MSRLRVGTFMLPLVGSNLLVHVDWAESRLRHFGFLLYICTHKISTTCRSLVPPQKLRATNTIIVRI